MVIVRRSPWLDEIHSTRPFALLVSAFTRRPKYSYVMGRSCLFVLAARSRRGQQTVSAWSVVLREGKREFEDLVGDEDAQVELRGVLVALEPYNAGSFLFRSDRRCLEHVGLYLLSRVRQIVRRGDGCRGLINGTHVCC